MLFSLGVCRWLEIAQHILYDLKELAFRERSQLYILLQLNYLLFSSAIKEKKNCSPSSTYVEAQTGVRYCMFLEKALLEKFLGRALLFLLAPRALCMWRCLE